ncbi:MAG: hypothetical protein WKG01_19445 [Kofleriaceae bacterium]
MSTRTNAWRHLELVGVGQLRDHPLLGIDLDVELALVELELVGDRQLAPVLEARLVEVLEIGCKLRIAELDEVRGLAGPGIELREDRGLAVVASA